MPWYIYWALRQLSPSGKRVSFFFVISISGVMLGVWILVVVQSVMGGFGMTYREKIVEINGNIRIETGKVIPTYEPLLEMIRKDSSVKAAAPYAQGVVMLAFNNRPKFPFLRGIDPKQEGEIVPIEEFLIVGSVANLDDDSLFLSRSLAASIGVELGSMVEVYTPLMLERLKQDEVLLPVELRVAGIYETGWHETDSNTILGTLRLMQDLYNLGRGIHGISIALHPGEKESEVAERLKAKLPPENQVLTWMEMYENLLWVLKLEKVMMFFLMIPIIVVAAFAIANAQLLTVTRKTREIGLLGALGGKPRHLIACFCFQGFIIGGLGTGFGIAFALVFLHFRGSIIHWIAGALRSEEVLIQFYQFSELPVHYAKFDFIVISCSTLVLTTVAGLIPAWRATRLNVADALRIE